MKKSAAMVAPPMGEIRRRGLWRAKLWLVGVDEAEAAVVSTVSIVVTTDVPAIDTFAAIEHLGASTASAGPVTAHESETLLPKPPLGVIVIVEVPLAPGESMLTGVLVRTKPGGGAFTVTATLV